MRQGADASVMVRKHSPLLGTRCSFAVSGRNTPQALDCPQRFGGMENTLMNRIRTFRSALVALILKSRAIAFMPAPPWLVPGPGATPTPNPACHAGTRRFPPPLASAPATTPPAASCPP